MYPGGYTAEVTSLSPKATEKDVYDFFANCGAIEHVQLIRSGEYACTAYVTFKDAYALETAILLSGATIVDQRVCITRWGSYVDDADPWNNSSWNNEYGPSPMTTSSSQFVSSPGEAITLAQEVVKTMVAKGYVLGKDAMVKAKGFDESLQVSATATAKVAELSNKIGLTDKINAGLVAAKSIDERYQVSDKTMSAATATGRTAAAAAATTGRAAAAAASAVVNSSYFAKGSLWVSDFLSRAAKAAADMGNQASHK